MNGKANRARKKQSSATIASDVRRFAHVINKDGVLGTDRADLSSLWEDEFVTSSLWKEFYKGNVTNSNCCWQKFKYRLLGKRQSSFVWVNIEQHPDAYDAWADAVDAVLGVFETFEPIDAPAARHPADEYLRRLGLLA